MCKVNPDDLSVQNAIGGHNSVKLYEGLLTHYWATATRVLLSFTCKPVVSDERERPDTAGTQNSQRKSRSADPAAPTAAFSLDDQRGEGHPHWVVRWKEVEVTSEVVGKGGWGEVRVVISSEGYMWLQSVSSK